MNSALSFYSIVSDREKRFLLFLFFIIVIAGAFAFPLSYLTNSNELIGLCLLPFVITIQGGRRFNYIFFSIFILLGLGAWIFGIHMFYFFSLAFYLLWLIEIFLGTLSILTVFLLIFMSPVFFQVSVILGFPIRLQLSEIAGTLLQWVGIAVQINGNSMHVNKAIFTVDEACVGLNLLAFSMLMGVFILAHNARVAKKLLRMKHIIMFFIVAFMLNVIANLLRIIVLVVFKIPQENPMHEAMGILCLVIYILIPLYKFGGWIIFKYGYEPISKSKDISLTSYGKLIMMVMAFVLLYVGIHINQRRENRIPSYALLNTPGFDSIKLDDGVIKLERKDALIYIKTIPEFFSGEHTPLICWKGSGYKFKSIRTMEIYGKEVYSGILGKQNELLYTAWWYDNGNFRTISQFEWRIRAMKGEKFSLVNVTSSDEATLKENVRSILRDPLFKIKQ